MSLRQVAWDRYGGAAKLIRQPVGFLLGKLTSDEVNFSHKSHPLLPSNQIAVSLHTPDS